MKVRIITIAIGFSVVVFAARANDILRVTELGETFNSITATLNGNPVAITLTGDPLGDHWTIQFPAGFALNLVGSPGIHLGEPENPSLYNMILITQPTFMLWDSDLPIPVGVIFATQNPITITNAGTGPNGALDLVLTDGLTDGQVSVPDASSTLCLLGMGLAGMAYFARMRRAAA